MFHNRFVESAGNLFDPKLLEDEDVEAMGEEFVAAVTSAEYVGEVARDELTGDEIVPFWSLRLDEEDADVD
jgi:hypothetical protein